MFLILWLLPSIAQLWAQMPTGPGIQIIQSAPTQPISLTNKTFINIPLPETPDESINNEGMNENLALYTMENATLPVGENIAVIKGTEGMNEPHSVDTSHVKPAVIGSAAAIASAVGAGTAVLIGRSNMTTTVMPEVTMTTTMLEVMHEGTTTILPIVSAVTPQNETLEDFFDEQKEIKKENEMDSTLAPVIVAGGGITTTVLPQATLVDTSGKIMNVTVIPATVKSAAMSDDTNENPDDVTAPDSKYNFHDLVSGHVTNVTTSVVSSAVRLQFLTDSTIKINENQNISMNNSTPPPLIQELTNESLLQNLKELLNLSMDGWKTADNYDSSADYEINMESSTPTETIFVTEYTATTINTSTNISSITLETADNSASNDKSNASTPIKFSTPQLSIMTDTTKFSAPETTLTSPDPIITGIASDLTTTKPIFSISTSNYTSTSFFPIYSSTPAPYVNDMMIITEKAENMSIPMESTSISSINMSFETSTSPSMILEQSTGSTTEQSSAIKYQDNSSTTPSYLSTITIEADSSIIFKNDSKKLTDLLTELQGSTTKVLPLSSEKMTDYEEPSYLLGNITDEWITSQNTTSFTTTILTDFSKTFTTLISPTSPDTLSTSYLYETSTPKDFPSLTTANLTTFSFSPYAFPLDKLNNNTTTIESFSDILEMDTVLTGTEFLSTPSESKEKIITQDISERTIPEQNDNYTEADDIQQKATTINYGILLKSENAFEEQINFTLKDPQLNPGNNIVDTTIKVKNYDEITEKTIDLTTDIERSLFTDVHTLKSRDYNDWINNSDPVKANINLELNNVRLITKNITIPILSKINQTVLPNLSKDNDGDFAMESTVHSNALSREKTTPFLNLTDFFGINKTIIPILTKNYFNNQTTTAQTTFNLDLFEGQSDTEYFDLDSTKPKQSNVTEKTMDYNITKQLPYLLDKDEYTKTTTDINLFTEQSKVTIEEKSFDYMIGANMITPNNDSSSIFESTKSSVKTTELFNNKEQSIKVTPNDILPIMTIFGQSSMSVIKNNITQKPKFKNQMLLKEPKDSKTFIIMISIMASIAGFLTILIVCAITYGVMSRRKHMTYKSQTISEKVFNSADLGMSESAVGTYFPFRHPITYIQTYPQTNMNNNNNVKNNFITCNSKDDDNHTNINIDPTTLNTFSAGSITARNIDPETERGKKISKKLPPGTFSPGYQTKKNKQTETEADENQTCLSMEELIQNDEESSPEIFPRKNSKLRNSPSLREGSSIDKSLNIDPDVKRKSSCSKSPDLSSKTNDSNYNIYANT